MQACIQSTIFNKTYFFFISSSKYKLENMVGFKSQVTILINIYIQAALQILGARFLNVNG